MSQVLRDKVSAVWALLVVATAISWWLGSEHVSSLRLSSVLVLMVAFIKVSLIGAYFMELRYAPAWLQTVFQGWCVAGFAATAGAYLVL